MTNSAEINRIIAKFSSHVEDSLEKEVHLWHKHLSTERRLSEHTVCAYMRDVYKFLLFIKQYEGNTPSLESLSLLERADFRAFLASEKNRGITPRSLSRILSSIRSFLSHLQEKKQIASTAMANLRLPRYQKPLPKPVSEKDALHLVEGNYFGTHPVSSTKLSWVILRDRAIFALLYGCGLRLSESLSLTRRELIFLTREKTIETTGSLRIVGKGRKERDVPVLPLIKKAIAQYLVACPYSLEDDAPAFRGEKGGVLSGRVVRKRLEQLRAALPNTSKATPHALRHAFASHLLAHDDQEAGQRVSLRSLQELLGHANLATTQIYTHVNAEQILRRYNRANPRKDFMLRTSHTTVVKTDT